MTSQFPIIANAVQAVVAALDGAPSRVMVKDTDNVSPDECPCVVITMGDEVPVLEVSGAGTDTDQGDRCVGYQIGVSVYRENLAANQSHTGAQQNFVRMAQAALAKKTLSGAPTVYGARVERRHAWENRPFAQGFEKSVFMVTFFSSETRLGN